MGLTVIQTCPECRKTSEFRGNNLESVKLATKEGWILECPECHNVFGDIDPIDPEPEHDYDSKDYCGECDKIVEKTWEFWKWMDTDRVGLIGICPTCKHGDLWTFSTKIFSQMTTPDEVAR